MIFFWQRTIFWFFSWLCFGGQMPEVQWISKRARTQLFQISDSLWLPLIHAFPYCNSCTWGPKEHLSPVSVPGCVCVWNSSLMKVHKAKVNLHELRGANGSNTDLFKWTPRYKPLNGYKLEKPSQERTKWSGMRAQRSRTALGTRNGAPVFCKPRHWKRHKSIGSRSGIQRNNRIKIE